MTDLTAAEIYEVVKDIKEVWPQGLRWLDDRDHPEWWLGYSGIPASRIRLILTGALVERLAGNSVAIHETKDNWGVPAFNVCLLPSQFAEHSHSTLLAALAEAYRATKEPRP